MPRQTPQPGDLFAVPLDDGTWALGQVLDTVPILANSFTCAFFARRTSTPQPLLSSASPTSEELLSCQFVTREQFVRGAWPRLGNAPIAITRGDWPYRRFLWMRWPRRRRVLESGLIERFLSAYHGLRPWTEMHDPSFYDTLLVSRRHRAGTEPSGSPSTVAPESPPDCYTS